MRETLEVDVLIVGGGPAGMSAALRLAQLQKGNGGQPLAIAVLEKAREAGAHMLSGAMLDPVALEDLVPDFKEKGAPLASEVHQERVYFLTKTGRFPAPIIPPPLQNHGNYIISLNRFVKWMAGLVEAEGIDLFAGFPAAELLYEDARVVGVRTRDQGIDKHGAKKSTFEPGVDIRAKVTILCDGVRGNLTKALVRRLALDEGRQPQLYAIGIKELWEVPKDRIAAGTVIHTLGYPLRMEEFGGGFLYAMPDGVVSLGLVTGLDYKDPLFDPHQTFQHFKQHPLFAGILEGGQMVRYGAKALPEGGWYTIPRTYADGVLIAQFNGLIHRQTRQRTRQRFQLARSSAANQNRNHCDLASYRRLNLMAHIIKVMVLQARKQNLTPSRSDHNQRRIAPRKSLIDGLREVLPGRDILQVHEHAIRPEHRRQVIAQPPRIRRRVLTPVADKDVARGGSLRNCSDTIAVESVVRF